MSTQSESKSATVGSVTEENKKILSELKLTEEKLKDPCYLRHHYSITLIYDRDSGYYLLTKKCKNCDYQIQEIQY